MAGCRGRGSGGGRSFALLGPAARTRRGLPGRKAVKAWRAVRRVVLICSLTSALARKENRLRCMVFLSFLSVAVLVGSSNAYALQAQPLDPEAARLIEKAHQAHDLGRFNEAIESYARAYQLTGEYALLFRLAEAYREAGRDADALRTFQTYVKRDPQGVHREMADREIKELEQKVKKGGSAKAIGVGAAAAARAPSPAPAEKAERNEGEPSARAAVVVPAPVVALPPAVVSVSPPVAVVPPPMPAPPPPAVQPPRVVTPAVPPPVRSPPRPPVVISPFPPPTSSPPTAPAPVAVRRSPPAPARPVATAPAPFAPIAVTASAVPGADLTAPSQPPSQPAPSSGEPPLPRWVPWAAAVATVALGTSAIVSGLSASNRFDDLKGSCGQTPVGCDPSQVDDVRSRAHRATLLWALTGAAAVGTGVVVYVNTSAAGASGLWAF